MITLTPRDRRALRLGAFVAIPLVLYFLVLAPLGRAIANGRESVAQEREALARERQLIEQASQFESNRAKTADWLSHETQRLFRGSDALAATSDLMTYVTGAAERAGVQIRQIETRPSMLVTGSLYAVQLNTRFEGNTRAVLTFLRTLEGANRLVRLGRLTTSSVSLASNTPSRTVRGFGGPMMGGTAASDTKARGISVLADIYGYALLPPPAEVRVASGSAGAPYQPMTARTIPALSVASAIANDPFSPTRGEVIVPPAPSFPAPPPPFPITLLGTVIGDDTFAVYQMGTATPREVRIGQRVAGYTLLDIQRAHIVLADASGNETHLRLPSPGF